MPIVLKSGDTSEPVDQYMFLKQLGDQESNV